jgi:hypothetical protein
MFFFSLRIAPNRFPSAHLLSATIHYGVSFCFVFVFFRWAQENFVAMSKYCDAMETLTIILTWLMVALFPMSSLGDRPNDSKTLEVLQSLVDLAIPAQSVQCPEKRPTQWCDGRLFPCCIGVNH